MGVLGNQRILLIRFEGGFDDAPSSSADPV